MPLFYFFAMNKQNHWDIFCTVIDNYGDIGVTWRLAKQLATEYQLPIKLWVDDLASFQHILPQLDPKLERQHFDNIEIIVWNQQTPNTWCTGEVIIEAFACELPVNIKSQLQELGTKAPTWLNLEYLSAEAWVDDIHGLPSIQNNGIKKYFFFPGFSEKSGGLTCESDLFERQQSFLAKNDVKANFLAKLGIEYRQQKIISVFSYETPALESLVTHFVNDEAETILLVPNSRSLTSITQALNIERNQLKVSESIRIGNLSLAVLPFTNQEGFDELLWLADINIIRGEDSFLRAQWAKKPFIWHIYPQDEQAHIEKLNAFLDRYCEQLPEDVAKIHRQVNLDFNLDNAAKMNQSWKKYISSYDQLFNHARNWPKSALNGSDLASRLVEFVKNR